MRTNRKSIADRGSLALAVALSLTGQGLVLKPVSATEALHGGVQKTTSATKRFFQQHDKIRSATVGAGVGTAAGAITGLVSGKGVLRGAAIGAGTGAGIGLIETSKTLKRHPIIKSIATGTTAGLGLGAAASGGEHSVKRVGEGAAVGAALGLGLGLLKDKLK